MLQCRLEGRGGLFLLVSQGALGAGAQGPGKALGAGDLDICWGVCISGDPQNYPVDLCGCLP